jgi:cell division transport system ATP-binding protein
LNATGWESKESVDNRINEVLNEVGLPEKINNYPKQMSGGEQQRLVIARALLNNPPVILADEPTGNLDPEMSDDIMKLLIRINREHNTAVLMATHNYQLIDRYPAKIYRCERNSVVEEKGIIM